MPVGRDADELLENVWDFNFDPNTNIVEVHMSQRRSKIEKGFEPELSRRLGARGISIVRSTGFD